MAHPKGDVKASPIVTGSETSKYGTHFDFLGIGGYLVVRTIAERDNIPVNPPALGLNFGDDLSSGRRRLGMHVRVLDPSVDDVFELFVTGYTAKTDLEKYTALASNDNWKSIVKTSSPYTAQSISFDPTATGLIATSVQAAIEEMLANPEANIDATNRAGTFNASNGLVKSLGAGPEIALPAANTSSGLFYAVTIAGTYASLIYAVDDWIYSDGTSWRRANNKNFVRRINGKSGDVTVGLEVSELLTIDTNFQTVFTLQNMPVDYAIARVFINGQKQSYPRDFTGSGVTLTWLNADFQLLKDRHTLEIYYTKS